MADRYRTQRSTDGGRTWEDVEVPRCPNEGQMCNCTGACQSEPVPGIPLSGILRAHEWPVR